MCKTYSNAETLYEFYQLCFVYFFFIWEELRPEASVRFLHLKCY
jgi:hypothetical protein